MANPQSSDADRWGEDRTTSPAPRRDRRRLKSILVAAMLLLGVIILFPFLVLPATDYSVGFVYGSAYAKVTGKVTYNGEPLPSGKITFVGAGGTEPGTGEIMDDGSYVVMAAPIGDVQVIVWHPSPYPTPGSVGFREHEEDLVQGKVAGAKRFVPVPGKYGSAATTPLRFTVKKGKNQFDIELTD